MHSPLLDKQHIKISECCFATFILDILGQCGRNLGENATGQNSDFHRQYKLYETEHHAEMLYVVYLIKEYAHASIC